MMTKNNKNLSDNQRYVEVKTLLPRIQINLWLRKNYLRKDGTHNLYCTIHSYGDKVEFGTGINIHPDQWKQNQQKATGVEGQVINEKIALILNRIENLRIMLDASGEPYSIKDIKAKITGKVKLERPRYTSPLSVVLTRYVDHEFCRIKAMRLSGSVRQKMIQLQRNLLEFISSHNYKGVTIGEIDTGFARNFEIFLANKYEAGHSRKLLHKFKSFISFAHEQGYIYTNPLASFQTEIKRENKPIIALTKEELTVIEKRFLDVERLVHTKDCFLFQCYTGLAYCDLSLLTDDSLQTDEQGRKWIVLARKKTRGKCYIPLLPKAEEIWNKYYGHLPVYSNVKLNAYLKEIQVLCGISTKLTTHLGRRTFATLLVNQGVSIEAVGSMLGHSRTQTTQQFYTDIKRDVVELELDKILGTQVQSPPAPPDDTPPQPLVNPFQHIHRNTGT